MSPRDEPDSDIWKNRRVPICIISIYSTLDALNHIGTGPSQESKHK